MGSPLFRFNKMKGNGKVERIVLGTDGLPVDYVAGRLPHVEVCAG